MTGQAKTPVNEGFIFALHKPLYALSGTDDPVGIECE